MSILNRSVDQTKFSNGYIASVVEFSDSTYEVAVMYNGKLVYDTPVTADVVRCETRAQAESVVDQIMDLPPRDGVRKHFGPSGMV
jgi:hypothetical protein